MKPFMIYAAPGQPGSRVTFKKRYENYIGGKWVAPVDRKRWDETGSVDHGSPANPSGP
jgi:aldehyde dehydrogenase